MASWMEERDRLVEQTRAFVAGVAAASVPVRPAYTPAAAAVPATAAAPPPGAPGEAAVTPASPVAVKSAEPPTMPPRLQRVSAPVSERAEIIQRVAAFKAHQSRLIRERDAYYQATQSKIRSKLGNELKPGPL